MSENEISKDRNRDADTVLSIILQSSSSPKKLYHPVCDFGYDYLQDLFRFIVDRCPTFIEIYAGTKPLGYIQMRPSAEKIVSKFLSSGGFDKFDNFDAYKSFQKKAKKPVNKIGISVQGDVVNSQMAIGSYASVLLDGNKMPNKIYTTKQNAITTTNSPLEKPHGWLKKLFQKIYENIGKILITIISGVILLLIKAHYNLK